MCSSRPPVYDGLRPEYVASPLRTCHFLGEAGVPCDWVYQTSSLVPWNRNVLAAVFGALPAFSHLLFVDGDMEWDPHDVLRLLAADKDVVAGVAAVRWSGPDAPLAVHPLPDAPSPCPRTGLVQVEAVGMAFVCIRRRVFARLAEAYPAKRITRFGNVDPAVLAYLYSFFPLLTVNGQLVGEDYAFCARWRAVGGKVWVDSTIRPRHHGSYVYEGDPAQMFGPAVGEGKAAAV